MNTRANTSWFAASSRRLAVVFSIFFLLASLLPSHADVGIFAAERGAIDTAYLYTENEDQPDLPDGIPGHLANQCACGITMLPNVMAQPVSLLIRPIQFVMGAMPFVRFGAQAPPVEPPRI